MKESTFTFRRWYGWDHWKSIELEEGSFGLEVVSANGDMYVLTVWTEPYLKRVLQSARESNAGQDGQYLLLPDLVLASDDDELVERTVADLLGTNRMREAWLIPDELTANFAEADPIINVEEKHDDSYLVVPLHEEGYDCGCCHLHPAK